MKTTTLLASVAVGALLAASTANGADMAVKAPRMVPAAAPVFSWTGCYAGAHVGWGWGQHDVTQADADFSSTGPRSRSGGIDSDGGIFGGQLGCNYQFAPSWVIGLQGDMAGANIKGSGPDPFVVPTDATIGVKTQWIASVTGRLGVTAWNNQALFYVKGGGAWARNRWDLSNSQLVYTVTEATETRSGWTVGAGAEWAFAPNWSVFAEYNHYDFGSGGVVASHFLTFNSNTFTSGKQTIDAVKLGVNYRFIGSMAR